MAEHGVKLNKQRCKLEEVIPLRTPMAVMIDVSSVCNLRCQFCPHGNSKTREQMPQAVMDVELAKKCIDDLTLFEDKIKKLSFYALGEPLLNKNLPEIIRYAADRNIAESLEITTNGTLLNHQKSEALIEAGITLIDLSLYGLNAESYQNFSGISLDFEAFVEEIRYLYQIRRQAELVLKISKAVCATPQEQEKFYHIFGDICDKICLESPAPIWYDVDIEIADKERNVYGETVRHKEVCAVPFYTMLVNSNGIVSPCGSDWNIKLPVGNVREKSLVSIWNSEEYKKLYVNLLKDGCANMTPCKNCHMYEFCIPDNIDPYRAELLKRIDE